MTERRPCQSHVSPRIENVLLTDGSMVPVCATCRFVLVKMYVATRYAGAPAEEKK